MPPYPPFRPLYPPHPSFLPTRLQWYKFASNPLTSDAFESVTVQQLLDIHVTAASANRVEMSFTPILFAEGKWVEIIILKNNKTNQNLVFVSSVRSSSGYHGLIEIRQQPTFSNFSNSSDSKVKVKVKGPNMCYIFEKHGIQGYQI